MPNVNTITLPQDVLDRVERVLEYHASTKMTLEPARHDAHGASHGVSHGAPHRADPASQPYEFRIFENLTSQPLPSGLLDLPVKTLSLMESGLSALPESQVTPPQDLKRLATWLHFADGIANRRRTVTATTFTRTTASDGNAFPCELYVAAFAIDGLDPGLYHYSPREFALRKLRDGHETLQRLTRGRPDLAFLKTIPLAMLVSTIFCRSTWKFGKRGYRHALHDAGYLVQNLVTVGTGLGVQTITRMLLNDNASRELIGVPADADFSQAEAVQAIVCWADRAVCPLPPAPAPRGAGGEPTAPSARGEGPTGTPPSAGLPTSGPPIAGPMAPIARPPLADEIVSYVSILETHQDCVAPGVAVREVRPPLTELAPLPPNVSVTDFPDDGAVAQPFGGEGAAGDALEGLGGEALRKILLLRHPVTDFSTRRINREQFMLINRLAFRGGAFYPLRPDGPHVALVRPFWVIHKITGMESGVWYYNPPTGKWSLLRRGDFRREAAFLADQRAAFGHSAATCFLVANLQYLMNVAGPDIYRLAHLEAGAVTNRLALSSEALDLAWCETGSFYDDDSRQFLGLRATGWEMINIIAIGTRLREGETRNAPAARSQGQ
jgi:SagB-type dehydrogenase family enzyme